MVLNVVPALHEFLRAYEHDLPALFIVSQVVVRPIEKPAGEKHLASDGALGMSVNVVKAEGEKCERCWNYRDAVGRVPEHPTLCDRCIEAVA